MSQDRSHNGYYLPPIEWANRTYKWVWSARFLPVEFQMAQIKAVYFSCSRQLEWWFKVERLERQYQYSHNPNTKYWTRETPWQPIPGFGFELPEHARLMKESAVLPPMTPEEWLVNRRKEQEEAAERLKQHATD